MRSLWRGSSLEALLRRHHVAPTCAVSPLHHRGYSRSSPLAHPHRHIHGEKDIAVIGGGITGLASAFSLSRELPEARITLYEAGSRMGGWVHTKQMNVADGTVVFEQGPRTLRPGLPNGLVTLEMISLLGIEDQVITTSKDSVAARNRFVYYPDHLVRMPGPGQSPLDMLGALFSEPVFEGAVWGFMGETFRPARPREVEDESVGAFISRRVGPAVADNIVSAVFHGIYAGDVYQLSASSLLPLQWLYEGRAGSITAGFWTLGKGVQRLFERRDADIIWEYESRGGASGVPGIMDASVFSFKRGIGTISEALEKALRGARNVSIKTQTAVKGIGPDPSSGGVSITTDEKNPPATHTHALCTLSGRTLSEVSSVPLPSLARMHAVTVMVVNLYFANPALLPARGFGYLIPRSVPFEQNPERALGVVFDSDACVGQDGPGGTKVTVMLGGHWWDGFDAFPDEDEAAAMARRVLARHLSITDEPTLAHVGLQRDCIPQYAVGHETRLRAAHEALAAGFGGRVRVAGNSYGGVGLNDCVRSGRDAARGLSRDEVGGEEGTPPEERTGLEHLARPRTWVPYFKSPSAAET
ncbi:MAG: oxygen-dependent protoporphyrinogen oxidase [Thelocarpon impressellum]|nr:MAG: oxygen-dependent protoporphyrinogen oxidase [Thelocarpon impressellum]